MKNLTKTASILDKILHIAAIAIKIIAVSLIVGLGILAAAFLFDLPPYLVGNGRSGFCFLYCRKKLSAGSPPHLVRSRNGNDPLPDLHGPRPLQRESHPQHSGSHGKR